jgi:hypothetical protein
MERDELIRAACVDHAQFALRTAQGLRKANVLVKFRRSSQAHPPFSKLRSATAMLI